MPPKRPTKRSKATSAAPPIVLSCASRAFDDGARAWTVNLSGFDRWEDLAEGIAALMHTAIGVAELDQPASDPKVVLFDFAVELLSAYGDVSSTTLRDVSGEAAEA